MFLPNERILFFSWLAMMILIVGLWPVSFFFLRRLRRSHPSTWSQLGEPTLFYNASMKNQRAVRKVVRSKAYLELNDPVLSRMAVVLKWGTRVGVALFVGFVLMFWLTQPGAGR